jgi:hypothetical protein
MIDVTNGHRNARRPEHGTGDEYAEAMVVQDHWRRQEITTIVALFQMSDDQCTT